MARTTTAAVRLKPEVSELLTLHAVRRTRVSRHVVRVTLGRGDAERFEHLGFDQWFRLFVPVADGEAALGRLPGRLTTLSYMRYLTISKATRPALRNYTVRAFRPDGPDGPEIDVDFVLHGSAADGTAGPAAAWAETCRPGDVVAILDEGRMFALPPGVDRVELVADESGLPATAAVLESLASSAPATRGRVIVELPSADDRQDLVAPDGVEITWLVRDDHAATPGRAALAAVEALPVPDEPFYGWTVGEQSLPAGVRRHWVRHGVPKDRIMFCGYWKAPRSH